MSLTIQPYCAELKSVWDQMVHEARQSSFLFCRDFMDYHKHRFHDASLLVFNQHQQLLALFPACVSLKNSHRVESHGGLTYGGLLLSPHATTAVVDEILHDCILYYRSAGFTELIYKPVPHIYQTYPAEEDLYALFRHHALLETRAVSSVIDLRNPYPFNSLRKRKSKKANKVLTYVESESPENVAGFWRMLNEVLCERHHTAPVHNLVELEYLLHQFPGHIRLFVAFKSNEDSQPSDEMVAGCLLFIMSRVIHVQYIASSDEGCRLGALDGLFDYLLHTLPERYPDKPYFDFGISTEEGGRVLNEGLIFQKEGFGGRAVCYDSYLLNLQ